MALKRGILTSVLSDMIGMYTRFHVSRAAAALSYFLTLTIFPLLICLYTMLRRFVGDVNTVVEFLRGIVPTEALQTLADYLTYVDTNAGMGIFIAGIIVLLTSSSAAYRSLHIIFSEMQGKSRYKGVYFFLFSFAMSLIFLVIMYFAAVVIITGDWFLHFIGEYLPMFDAAVAWNWIRFVLLFAVLFFALTGVYGLSAPKGKDKDVYIGAFAATVALVALSVLFSWVIGISTRYSLVYGSLASMILLMFWFYICGNVIIMGNALNIALRDIGFFDRKSSTIEKTDG